MTKLTLNLVDVLTDALGETVHVPTEIDLANLFEFHAAQEFELDIDDLLHDNRMIGHLWSIPDVRSIRPDLSDEQAWQILQHLDQQYDGSLGMSWNDLKRVAEQLFGTETGPRVARCETAIAGYGDDLPESNLIDFLSDAMHWCQASGLDFDAKLDMARGHFSAETSGE